MAKFGGSSSFGRSHFGGVRYPTSQGYLIERMVAAMSGFVDAGSIKTCARLYGDPARQETWDAVLTPSGLPAVLVHYAGGTFRKEATSGARLAKRMRFTVYCFGGDYRSWQQRVEGNEYDDGAAEQLTAWCAYYMYRALNELKIKNLTLVDEKPLGFTANAVAYTVGFQCDQTVDMYDDQISTQLESLGICHTPKNLTTLFEDDNETPYSDDEPIPSPNVADLTAED